MAAEPVGIADAHGLPTTVGATNAQVVELLRPLATDKHPIAPCDRCGAPILAAVANTPPCRITPKCDGNHQPKDTRT